MILLVSSIVFIFFALLCAIAAHEFSHMFMGYIQGWKFYYITFGPIGIRLKKENRIRTYFLRDPHMWGGSIAIGSMDTDKVTYIQVIRVIIAGPIGSVIFFLLTFGLWTVFGHIFYLLTCIFSLTIAMITLIPYRAGVTYTDGGKVRRLMTDGPYRDSEMAFHRIGSKVLASGTFSDAGKEDLRILSDSEDLREQYMGHYYAYEHYSATGLENMSQVEKVAAKGLENRIPPNIIRKM